MLFHRSLSVKVPPPAPPPVGFFRQFVPNHVEHMHLLTTVFNVIDLPRCTSAGALIVTEGATTSGSIVGLGGGGTGSSVTSYIMRSSNGGSTFISVTTHQYLLRYYVALTRTVPRSS